MRRLKNQDNCEQASSRRWLRLRRVGIEVLWIPRPPPGQALAFRHMCVRDARGRRFLTRPHCSKRTVDLRSDVAGELIQSTSPASAPPDSPPTITMDAAQGQWIRGAIRGSQSRSTCAARSASWLGEASKRTPTMIRRAFREAPGVGKVPQGRQGIDVSISCCQPRRLSLRSPIDSGYAWAMRRRGAEIGSTVAED